MHCEWDRHQTKEEDGLVVDDMALPWEACEEEEELHATLSFVHSYQCLDDDDDEKKKKQNVNAKKGACCSFDLNYY